MELQIFANDEFGYNKIVVERPLKDENGIGGYDNHCRDLSKEEIAQQRHIYSACFSSQYTLLSIINKRGMRRIKF